VVASEQSIDPTTFTKRLTEIYGGNEPVTHIMPEQELADYMAKGTQLVLTDDYAPVDQLIATLFDERGY